MTGNSGKHTRVLIVSLPGMLQNVLKDTFTCRMDVEVVGVASGGLSAVGMTRQTQPDLVVIDSNIPEIETDQLIRLIRDEHQFIRILVLAETTHQMKKVASLGADLTLRSYSLPDKLDSFLSHMNSAKG